MTEIHNPAEAVELPEPIAADAWRKHDRFLLAIESLAEAAATRPSDYMLNGQEVVVAKLVVELVKERQALTAERLALVKVESRITTSGFFANRMHFQVITERRAERWTTHLVSILGDRYATVLKVEISEECNLTRTYCFEPGPWIKEIFS
jgi:hypothetical protein